MGPKLSVLTERGILKFLDPRLRALGPQTFAEN
jgi:hypothetical protein